MNVVLSGVTSPRCTARPASISSDAMTMSTSPGTGVRPSTGGPVFDVVADFGNSST